MSETERRLLGELDEYRWFVMNQLADLADDEGNATLARGWRWLANNRKWPAHHGKGPGGGGEPFYYAFAEPDSPWQADEELSEHELPGDVDLGGPDGPRGVRPEHAKVSAALRHAADLVGRLLEAGWPDAFEPDEP
jgi:hypothetical protein